jgi:hypothetical protein
MAAIFTDAGAALLVILNGLRVLKLPDMGVEKKLG